MLTNFWIRSWSTLEGKRILLIVTGGIAAFKGPELVRLIKAHGSGVRAILTASGSNFVTPVKPASAHRR